jgi:hypothetical protein
MVLFEERRSWVVPCRLWCQFASNDRKLGDVIGPPLTARVLCLAPALASAACSSSECPPRDNLGHDRNRTAAARCADARDQLGRSRSWPAAAEGDHAAADARLCRNRRGAESSTQRRMSLTSAASAFALRQDGADLELRPVPRSRGGLRLDEVATLRERAAMARRWRRQ